MASVRSTGLHRKPSPAHVLGPKRIMLSEACSQRSELPLRSLIYREDDTLKHHQANFPRVDRRLDQHLLFECQLAALQTNNPSDWQRGLWFFLRLEGPL